jgi:MFS transporter, UMF1 family
LSLCWNAILGGKCLLDLNVLRGVADSAFTTVIVTTLYAPFYSKVVQDPGRADQLWGLAASVSEIVVALLAPVLGAIADFTGKRKQFLGLCAIGCLLKRVT